MLTTTLALALLTSPAPTDDLFPAADSPMVIEVQNAESEGMVLADFVTLYGEVTGQAITFDDETRQYLQNHRVPIDRTTTIPADEVQLLFERLMLQADFAIAPAGTEATPMVRVTSLASSARHFIRTGAIYLESGAALETAAMHPAVMFTTVVSMPHTDVRQVSNSMRTLILDANTQQMLPAGNTGSMVLVGFGDSLVSMIQTLKLIDDASAVAAKSRVIEVEMVKLQHRDAQLIDDVIRTAFRVKDAEGDTKGSSLAVIADAHTNALVLRGPKEDVERVKDLVAKLDVPSAK